jgi:hypothetical protein
MDEETSVKERYMATKTKHSKTEIAAKLAQADDLATQGKLQSEIAQTLGEGCAGAGAGGEWLKPRRSNSADANCRA